MKSRLFSVLVILAIGLAGFGIKPANAQAYVTSFTTSVTYMNAGTAATTTLQVLFFALPTTTTPVTITRPNLNAGAGTSLFIGSLSESDVAKGFRGAAVMQSDQPLLATLVQLPQGSATVRNRPLSNGFSAGAAQSLIATVLRDYFDTTTIFSVQNVDSVVNTVTIKFYDTTAFSPHSIVKDIQPGAAFYVDMGNQADPAFNTAFGAKWNGSAVVTSKRADNSDGAIISSAMELGTTTVLAKAFEGVAAGATKFYMPSALCNYCSTGSCPTTNLLTNTSFAVQNTSLTTPTDVTVTYSPGGAAQTQTIGPGAKASFIGCAATGMTQNFIGSAILTSTATPVVAIGKGYGGGMSTAFAGAADGTGVAKVALPYVRYANATNWANGSQQRVNITIQNIGAAPITNITVKYIDRNGAILATHTIAATVNPGSKVNSNASAAGLTEFGVYVDPDGVKYGGGALIECAGAQLAVVARVSTLNTADGTYFSEDYNGMPVP